MNHAASFASVIENDADLQALRERHGSVATRILETTDALLGLEGAIELARTTDNVRAMADAIVSGQDIATDNAPSLVELCDEQARQTDILKAHRIAGLKLESKIKERVAGLARDFFSKVADTRKLRASSILDGLLTIAEANADDAQMRGDLRNAGFPMEIFKGVTRPLSGWAPGHGPTDIAVIRNFIGDHAGIGFELSAEQTARLNTLDRNAP